VSRSLVLRPSAKINLTLRVGSRKSDGFHDVSTLLQSISLGDRLSLSARPGPMTLATRTPGVPDDRSNLVWRAADLLWKSIGRAGDPRGVHVRLEKRIPAAAGLGGGSADAAAMLVGCNRLWQAGRSRRDLHSLAAELGSDVPFFLQGGTALGLGRGDELFPVDDIGRLGVVILKPALGVSTPDAYRWLDEDRAAGVPPGRAPKEVDVGWPTGPVLVANDLEAPVGRRHPVVPAMVEACLSAGARAAGMTGSGSAVFGLFSETAARRAAERLARPDWLVLLARSLSRREAQARLGL
jgi:4-diphosphocytidyl-2-C-methyl-D-erythritol kinase